ncbi:serine dehydratase beta chain [Colwellia psychrerythraea]|uniref:serine dehydratase beta chain n=1 Tax=Colwellia psychrerythraea TaxID=28229 RepID=UPI000056DCC0|nr:serine dehydratase beta chain [Colwellia psychrerythraea]AAZ25901.1 L-serine dehydratase 1, truncated [Colwellia psychrerythraea 34H]
MISAFDMVSIGIDPSSSHTVGPMRAAFRFSKLLQQKKVLDRVSHVKTELFGSLAQTDISQGSCKAVLLGLAGFEPETIDPDIIDAFLLQVETTQRLSLLGVHDSSFPRQNAVTFHGPQTLPDHANAMELRAYNGEELLLSQIYYSVGGGFIVNKRKWNR